MDGRINGFFDLLGAHQYPSFEKFGLLVRDDL